MRRRPLMAAAVVGGTAYHIGKKGQQSRDQQAQIDEMQAQQDQQQYEQAPPQAAPAPEEDPMAKLTQLKSLLDSGVLTQAEFDFQKTKILQSM
ncbi:MAG TPA: SHOCT domain-containing protein [Thermoleophilia bacterium]|nr:SHOCT domain-containing protein [Thermoleophilia bacterium]